MIKDDKFDQIFVHKIRIQFLDGKLETTSSVETTSKAPVRFQYVHEEFWTSLQILAKDQFGLKLENANCILTCFYSDSYLCHDQEELDEMRQDYPYLSIENELEETSKIFFSTSFIKSFMSQEIV